MKEKMPQSGPAKGQIDLLDVREEEALVRSGEGEKMITNGGSVKKYQKERAIGFAALKKIKRMLQKRIDEDEHPKLDL